MNEPNPQISNKAIVRDILIELEHLYFRVKYLKHKDELDLTVVENMIERLRAALGPRYL